MNINFNYSGKVALVVGGSRGIGEQIVKDFISSGAKTFYISRNKNIKLADMGAIHIKCDIRNEYEIEKSFEIIENIDFLINCAAINFCKPIDRIDSIEWDDVFSVNLRSFYITSKLAIKKMKISGFGRIINISSIAGRNKSIVSGVHYTSTKSAIIGFTRQLANEVSGFGINVNATCPSQTMTDMLQSSMSKKELDSLRKSIPVNRISTVSEQSLPVLFLCSDAATYISGCILDINGGQI